MDAERLKQRILVRKLGTEEDLKPRKLSIEDWRGMKDGIQKFQTDLHSIVQKRTEPLYASVVAFQRQGLGETAAVQAAQRNSDVSKALDKLETTPEMLTATRLVLLKRSSLL
jgi:hypothetical protein